MIFKSGEDTGTEMEVRYSYLTQCGKMLRPVNCNKSPMYVAMPRETTMETTQEDMLKNDKHTKMES